MAHVARRRFFRNRIFVGPAHAFGLRLNESVAHALGLRANKRAIPHNKWADVASNSGFCPAANNERKKFAISEGVKHNAS